MLECWVDFPMCWNSKLISCLLAASQLEGACPDIHITYSTLCRELEDLHHVLNVNAIGTYAVTKAYLHLLSSGSQRTIINISSDAGSHTQNASFIHTDLPSEGVVGLSYRMSKAALNMRKWLHQTGLPWTMVKIMSSLVDDLC